MLRGLEAVTQSRLEGGDCGVLLGGREGGEGKVTGRADKRGAHIETFTASWFCVRFILTAGHIVC